MRLRRRFAVSLVLLLVFLAPGGDFYQAWGQVVMEPPRTGPGPVIEVPGGGPLAADLVLPSDPLLQRQWADQLQSLQPLKSLPGGSAAKAEALRAAPLLRDGAAASFAGSIDGTQARGAAASARAAADRPVPAALRAAPETVRSPAASPQVSDQAGPRTRLEAFGGFYRDGGLGANGSDDSGLKGKNDGIFERLLGAGAKDAAGVEGPSGTTLQGRAPSAALPVEVRFTVEFWRSTHRYLFRGAQWARLYGDIDALARGKPVNVEDSDGRGDAKAAGVRKFKWGDLRTRIYFHYDARQGVLTLLGYRPKSAFGHGEDAGRNQEDYYALLAAQARRPELLDAERSAKLTAKLRPFGTPAPETPRGSPARGLAANGPVEVGPPQKLTSGRDASGLAPPAAPAPSASPAAAPATTLSPSAPDAPPLDPKSFKVPFSLTARIHGYWSGALASCAAAFTLLVGVPVWWLFHTSPAAGFGVAALVVVHAVRHFARLPRGDGGRVDFAPADERWPVRDTVEWIMTRLGLDVSQAPRTGLDRAYNVDGTPDDFNAYSSGSSLGPKAVLAVGEGWLKEPQVMAGVLGHEFGHLYLGDVLRMKIWRDFHDYLRKLFAVAAWPLAAVAVASGLLHHGAAFESLRSAAGAALVAAAAAVASVGGFAFAILVAAPVLLFVSHLLGLAYMRNQELRADLFSAWVTHPTWIHEFVRLTMRPPDVTRADKLNRLARTHPDSTRRLANLEPLVKAFQPTPEIEAARSSLEDELLASGIADQVLAIHDGKEFVLAVTILNESPENMAKVAALPKEHRGLAVKPFRAPAPPEVEAARAELEAELVPAVAESVLAIHNGSGYVLTVVVRDAAPEKLSRITTPFQGLPVQAVLVPAAPTPS